MKALKSDVVKLLGAPGKKLGFSNEIQCFDTFGEPSGSLKLTSGPGIELVHGRRKMFLLAALADRIDRTEDLMNYIREAAKAFPDLSKEEQMLLVSAYKQLCRTYRNAWSVYNNKLKAFPSSYEELEMMDWYLPVLKALLEESKMKLFTLQEEAENLLNDVLLPQAINLEAEFIFSIFRADMLRYCIECSTKEDEEERYISEAEEAFHQSFKLLKQASLSKCNLNVLGLNLNFTVFKKEHKGDLQGAFQIGCTAIQEAIADMHSLENEQEYIQCVQALQTFSENVKSWGMESGKTLGEINKIFGISEDEESESACEERHTEQPQAGMKKKLKSRKLINKVIRGKSRHGAGFMKLKMKTALELDYWNMGTTGGGNAGKYEGAALDEEGKAEQPSGVTQRKKKITGTIRSDPFKDTRKTGLAAGKLAEPIKTAKKVGKKTTSAKESEETEKKASEAKKKVKSEGLEGEKAVKAKKKEKKVKK